MKREAASEGEAREGLRAWRGACGRVGRENIDGEGV